MSDRGEMSERTDTTDATRLERAMWLKPPHEIQTNGWFYWTFTVLCTLVIFLSVRTSISQEFGVSAVQDASTAVLLAVGNLGLIAEGLYAGIYFGGRSAVVKAVGRKLRLWLSFLVLAFFPFYVAAHVSGFGVGREYGAAFWAMVGGVVGVILVVALILHIRRRYRRLGGDTSRTR